MPKNNSRNSKNNLSFKNEGKLSSFTKKYKLETIIQEKDTTRMFYKEFLGPREVLNNSHIYIKWSDYIFEKGKENYCPINKCLNCPTRGSHMSYAASKHGYTENTKNDFLDNYFDKRWNILSHIPPNQLKYMFENFISELMTLPKSTGSKRASSSINTYISQIKKWEKKANYLTGTNFNITSGIKKKLNTKFSIINILEPEMLNKIIDCVLNDSIWRNKLIHSRVKSIFFIMIQTGIRQSELIKLNKTDYTEGILSINEGGKIRRVALNENSKKILDEYINDRFDNNDSLFVNQDFNSITKSTVENGWKRISNAIDLHFSSMDLRKTSAVLFAKSGSSIDELKNLYGFRTRQIAAKYHKEGTERRFLEKQKGFDPIREIN